MIRMERHEVERVARQHGARGRSLGKTMRALANVLPNPETEPEMLPFDKRKHKFNAKPVVRGDRFYASTAEADRHPELELLHRAGHIGAVQPQRVVTLIPGIDYRPDYTYEEKGRLITEDVKGADSERWRLIKKLWRFFGDGILRVTKRQGRYGRFMVAQEIVATRPTCDACGAEIHPETWT